MIDVHEDRQLRSEQFRINRCKGEKRNTIRCEN